MKKNLPGGKRRRCWTSDNPLLLEYHDNEWGLPARDDRLLFEHLVLGGFQAGLSWGMILNKRKNFRKAFKEFDPRRVAAFREREIQKLLSDAGIVRNRMKIEAAIGNAQAFVTIQDAFGTFSEYVWDFIGGKPIRKKHPGGKLPARTPDSDRLSEDLKDRGFRFIGTTITYAFMQSVGLVNDHLPGCWRLQKEKR